jgi:hypothetical protein
MTADVALPRWFDGGAERLVSRLREDGGFTVDPRTGTVPGSGFAVNCGAGVLVVPAPTFVDDGAGILAGFVRARPELLDAGSSLLLGGWHHRASDRVVLSPVDHVGDRDEAVALGVARGQTDVYDLGEGRTVPTGVVRRT